MKIPFTNIEIGRVQNVKREKKRRDMSDILKRITETQLVRAREDVNKWRTALSLAESKVNPDRTDLNRVFNDIMLDAHLTSLVQTIILKVQSTPFHIENEKGDIEDELSAMFRKRWFRDLVRYVVEAPIYGYSLVQFGDIIDGCFSYTELVPREYVVPEKKAVKSQMRMTMTGLTYFEDPPFDAWTTFIHEPRDMGLLTKAAPLVIWKKNVLGAWSEAAELFGMPIRTGKTDINNPSAYANMTAMLENMGSAAWAVMDSDDEINFVEITKSDYFNVYDRLIERVNSELSKLILGQTMTSDDGSSRSQAEVHERVLDDYIAAMCALVTDTVNDEVLPLMQRHGLIGTGFKLVHDNEEKIDIETRFEMVNKIASWRGVRVPMDYVTETFGIPLDEVAMPSAFQTDAPKDDDGNPIEDDESVMPTVSNLYKSISEHKH